MTIKKKKNLIAEIYNIFFLVSAQYAKSFPDISIDIFEIYEDYSRLILTTYYRT